MVHCEMCDFLTPNDPHSHMSWDKCENPYPLRNCMIPNSATAGAPRTTWPVALWLLGPDSCLVWNHAISQWVWALATILPSQWRMWFERIHFSTLRAFDRKLLHIIFEHEHQQPSNTSLFVRKPVRCFSVEWKTNHSMSISYQEDTGTFVHMPSLLSGKLSWF